MERREPPARAVVTSPLSALNRCEARANCARPIHTVGGCRRGAEHERRENLDPEVKLLARWETERDVIGYAVMLLARIEGAWRTVVLFDCTHGDRNDRHRYSFDGVKEPAVIFHMDLPAKR